MSNGRHLGRDSEIPILADDGKLRLYSMRFCPFAQRVHLVLDAKGIPYHTIYINLTEKPEWFFKKSPLGKVPALEIPQEKENTILFESLMICEYLNEIYPEKPLFPKDPLQKAKDKILAEQFNAVIYPLHNEHMPGAIAQIFHGLDTYEKELDNRGTPYFGGDKPGMLDYMIWPWCERIDMLKYITNENCELHEQRFAKLIEWRSLMKDDKAVMKTFISGEGHAKFIESRKIGKAIYDLY